MQDIYLTAKNIDMQEKFVDGTSGEYGGWRYFNRVYFKILKIQLQIQILF